MPDIQKWILQLQSDNPNKRYEACEELRVAPSITDEALDALREVTNDPDADVADAAQRAIDTHTGQINPVIPLEATESVTKSRGERFVYPLISAIAAFISSAIIQSKSPGYIEDSKWVPILPFVLCFYSTGLALFASLISWGLSSVLLTSNRKPLLIALLSLVIGILIGLVLGMFTF